MYNFPNACSLRHVLKLWGNDRLDGASIIRSKRTCFVQFKRPYDCSRALEKDYIEIMPGLTVRIRPYNEPTQAKKSHNAMSRYIIAKESKKDKPQPPPLPTGWDILPVSENEPGSTSNHSNPAPTPTPISHSFGAPSIQTPTFGQVPSFHNIIDGRSITPIPNPSQPPAPPQSQLPQSSGQRKEPQTPGASDRTIELPVAKFMELILEEGSAKTLSSAQIEMIREYLNDEKQLALKREQEESKNREQFFGQQATDSANGTSSDRTTANETSPRLEFLQIELKNKLQTLLGK